MFSFPLSSRHGSCSGLRASRCAGIGGPRLCQCFRTGGKQNRIRPSPRRCGPFQASWGLADSGRTFRIGSLPSISRRPSARQGGEYVDSRMARMVEAPLWLSGRRTRWCAHDSGGGNGEYAQVQALFDRGGLVPPIRAYERRSDRSESSRRKSVDPLLPAMMSLASGRGSSGAGLTLDYLLGRAMHTSNATRALSSR